MANTSADIAQSDLRGHRETHSASELRKLYREEGDVLRRSAARHGLWMAVFVYVLFAIPDMLLIWDVSIYTIPARFAVGAIVVIALEIQFRMQVKTDWLDVTCAVALVSGYVGWLYPAMMTAQTQSLSYYMIFGAIFMMGANLFFSFRSLYIYPVQPVSGIPYKQQAYQ